MALAATESIPLALFTLVYLFAKSTFGARCPYYFSDNFRGYSPKFAKNSFPVHCHMLRFTKVREREWFGWSVLTVMKK